MSARPCPVCDVTAMACTPVMAMAFGVALGVAFGDQQPVTERVCSAHRPLWAAAMVSAAVAIGTVDEPVPDTDPAPASEVRP